MKESSEKQAGITTALWALLMLYAGARVLQVFPGKVPIAVVVALHVLPPIVFALIHGAMFYRARGILIFFAICLVVGNSFSPSPSNWDSRIWGWPIFPGHWPV
jgi:hypothetical protein